MNKLEAFFNSDEEPISVNVIFDHAPLQITFSFCTPNVKAIKDDPIKYIYLYLDSRKPGRYDYGFGYVFDYEPFYVGKGTENKYYKRTESHLNEAKKILFGEQSWEEKNNHKIAKIHNIWKETGKDPIVVKVHENLFYKDSIYFEKALIHIIGRADKGEGPLTNMTDGGEGWESGRKHSEETKEKISKKNKGKKHSPERKQHQSEMLKGKKKSQKWIENFCMGENNSAFGKVWTDEQKKSLSETRKKNGKSKGKNNYFYGKSMKGMTNSNSKYKYYFCKDGINWIDFDGVTSFCFDHKLDSKEIFFMFTKNRLIQINDIFLHRETKK